MLLTKENDIFNVVGSLALVGPLVQLVGIMECRLGLSLKSTSLVRIIHLSSSLKTTEDYS